MRFSRKIFFLLALASLNLHAQISPRLAPGMAAQMMVPQAPVEASQLPEVSAAAEFDPPVVGVGEKTFYRVRITATQNSIEWPDEISAPPELKFGAGARGQLMQPDGVRFSPLTSFVYEVTPTATGHFSVPSFPVPAGWPPVEVPAASLDVVATNSPAGAARRLLLEVSETNLFFGQPFRVRVLLPAGPNNQLEMLRDVQFNGVGYLTDKLSTRQSFGAVNLGGEQKNAFAYEITATPMALGALGISAQGFTSGGQFGGPITIQANGGPVVFGGGTPKYVMLVADEIKLNVRPLPAEGELPGFTGALGKFIAEKPGLATNTIRVGEPVRLRFGFRPAGELTRFVPPEAPRSRAWQIIADNPPGNGFTLIPQTDDATNTPAIPFSAFDPATQKYYDLTLPGLPVTVIGEGLPVQIPEWNADEKTPAALRLSGLASAPGKTIARLKPLQLQGWFVFVQILPALGFIALWRWDERRRFWEAHPDLVRRRKAKRDLRRKKIELQKAVATGDPDNFSQQAADALRIAVAPHFPANDRALVGGDVLAQLGEVQRHGREGEIVRNIFAATDARFADAKKETADLIKFHADVNLVLQQLEAKL